MNLATVPSYSIKPMSDEAISKAKQLEAQMLKMPQVNIQTTHTLHGGMYARTVKIPAGVLVSGAMIRVKTMMIVDGHIHLFVGDKTIKLKGHHVIPASENRKQAALAIKDSYVTMIFSTQASTVEEAEAEFTDEHEMLMTNKTRKIK